MSDIAIKIENVGKMYQLGPSLEPYSTLREEIGKFFHSNSNNDAIVNKFWALKDISFTVKKGEVLGIIGSNGAGKSTLLKILSRITSPTEGKIVVHGRIGSLLEVGTGFHPELTGRENIFLNGSILGMKKAEIDEKFDEIVKFSEIEKFLDTPVKRYSSGMYVRLAFAVAAHLDPEILLVDEVLAVGDAQFQKKCLGKMGEVAKDGRTVLFVSHNMVAVQTLCKNTILIQSGKIGAYGPTNQIVSQYIQQNLVPYSDKTWDNINTAPGNEKIRMHHASIRPLDDISQTGMTTRSKLILTFEYWNLYEGLILNLSVHIFNESGVRVFNTFPVFEPTWNGKPFPKGLFRSTCIIPEDLLNDGFYYVDVHAVQNQGVVIYDYKEILSFTINDDPSMRTAWFDKWPGIVRPNLVWTTKLIKPV